MPLARYLSSWTGRAALGDVVVSRVPNFNAEGEGVPKVIHAWEFVPARKPVKKRLNDAVEKILSDGGDD